MNLIKKRINKYLKENIHIENELKQIYFYLNMILIAKTIKRKCNIR
jgi:hypothetical protein